MRSRSVLIWSSLFFILPLVLAVHLNIWISAAALSAVILTSLAYHLSHEKKFKRIDAFFAWLLIFSNLWLCYLGNFSMPYFGVAVVLAIGALFLYFYLQKKDHYLGHSLWHFFSVLITVFSLLTYL